VNGHRNRQKPAYCLRKDGQYLFYHGKENVIYGETESGKDMMLAETVAQCMESWIAVSWIDFEEGDEIDCGKRLLEMGVEPEALVDQDLFRFSTPEDVEAAQDSVYDALTHRCQLVILNGVQSAYGLFGWDLYDPTSPAMFRRALVTPLLNHGRTVIETDHMTKSSVEGKGNGSRYAAGGMAKLNWINGAAYLLEAVDPIVRGSTGKSRLLLTKDRPGSVKPQCERIKDEPRMMFAGMLVIKSVGDENAGYDLMVEVTAPLPGSVVREKRKQREAESKVVPDDVLEKVLALYKTFGRTGASKAAIEATYRGEGARYVRAAIDVLQAYGCLVKAGKSSSSNIAPLRYAKEWDPKMKVTQEND
jgi:hypothetical protein